MDIELSSSALDLQDVAACRTALKMRYGAAADGIVRDAQAAVKRLGVNVARYLDETSAGNAPGVLIALAEFHRGSTRLSPEAAQKELTKLRSSKEFWAGERYAVDRARLLANIAARGTSREMAMPTKQTPVAKSAAQSELEKLRRDPSYFDRYAPNHKVVAARVAELMKQIHPD